MQNRENQNEYLNSFVLDTLLDSMGLIVYITNIETDEIIYMSQNMLQEFQIKDPIGKKCWELLQTGMECRCSFCPITQLLKQEENTPYIWEEYNTKNNRIYENTDILVRWRDGKLVHLQHSKDITRYKKLLEVAREENVNWNERKESEKLIYLLGHDTLTGIYNREFFLKKVEIKLLNATKDNYYLVLFDIAHFKVINDLFGRNIGDLILQRFAELLNEIYQEDALFGRLEADHFGLCIKISDFHVEDVINYLEKELNEIISNYEITIHVGIYIIHDTTVSVELMCDRARLALTHVKDNYLKKYAIYGDELRRALLREQQIVSEMNTALEEGQFQFYLQPVFSIASSSPICAEALVRWMHPIEKMIPPDKFIPIFEKNGFITKLDYYIWESVCQFLHNRIKMGKEVIPISVNISRINLYNPNFFNIICDLVKKYEMDPKYLRLEITESAYMDNAKQLSELVQKLREKGFLVLMDDFGSGYSSLNMLMDIPVDILKLDMRFMGSVGNSGRAANLLTSVVRMAKWLDIDVLAEGVETKAQLDFLRGIACDKIQGYYYSRPLPIEEFDKLMEEKRYLQVKKEDDTINKQFDLSAFLNSSEVANVIFNGIIDGLGIYELDNNKLEVLRVNDGYYEIMGTTPEVVFSDTKDAFMHVHKEDKPLLLEACKKAYKSKSIQNIHIRRFNENKHVLYLSLKIRFIGNRENRQLFFFSICDVTEKRNKDLERRMNQYMKEIFSQYDEIVRMDFLANRYQLIYKKVGDKSRIGIDRKGLRSALIKFINKWIYVEDQKEAHEIFYNIDKKINKYGVYIWKYRFLSKTTSEVQFCESVILKISNGCYLYCTKKIY